MLTKTINFRNQTYGDLYRLRFEGPRDAGDIWKAFVEKRPHNPRSSDPKATHILSGNQLCFTEKPRSKERVKALALAWILYYSKYVRTGETRQPSIRAHINEE